MARPDDGGPGGSKVGRTEVRFALRVRFDLNLEPFVLPAADVFQVDPFGLGGSFLVQVDRDI